MKKRAAGYIRVSSKDQIDNTSLEDQRAAITKYAEQQGWSLITIYADEGISGKEMTKREGLLKLLKDAADNKFDVMICDKIDRFGRGLRDILNNRFTLAEVGVEECFLDGLQDPEAFRQVKGVFAEYERREIRKRTMRGRLSRLSSGKPIGCPPFNRRYDREAGEWSFIDPRKNELLEWAAAEYLNGGSMTIIAQAVTEKGFKINQAPLNRLLRDKCGDKWIYKLDGRTFEIPMPRILPQATIEALHERMKHRRTNNRIDVKRYVLSGYIRCEKCGRALTGHTMRGQWTYYKHPTDDCNPGFHHIPMGMIDQAVFHMVRNYIIDAAGYRKAVAEKAPDDTMVHGLQQDAQRHEKALRKAEAELNALYKAVAEQTITNREYITKFELELTNRIKQDKAELDSCHQRLAQLPSREEYVKKAEQIRGDLLLKFASLEHLLALPYAQKRRVLWDLFSGGDLEGKRYGVYIAPREDKRRKAFWRFTVHTEFMTVENRVRHDGVFFSEHVRRKGKRRKAKDIKLK